MRTSSTDRLPESLLLPAAQDRSCEMESEYMIAEQVKPYIPITALRERAREAYQAQVESEAAERADVYAAGRRNTVARLVKTCAELFHIDVDPYLVETEVIATWEPTIRATVVVDNIALSIVCSASSPPSNRRLTVDAVVLCPVCHAWLSPQTRVSRLAEIGALLGEVGCECGWMPDGRVAS